MQVVRRDRNKVRSRKNMSENERDACEMKLAPIHTVANSALVNGVRLRKHNQYDLKMLPILLPFLFLPGKEKNYDSTQHTTKCFWREVCPLHLSFCVASDRFLNPNPHNSCAQSDQLVVLLDLAKNG